MAPNLFNTKTQFLHIFSFCIVSACSFLFSKSYAQGNLLVTPKRIVFEGLKRSEELNLANTGKDSAMYNISFIQIRMREDGTMENITEPDSAQLFADKYLRFFPRTVTLAPNEAQTIKLQLTNKEDMSEGEYRSHLYFRAVPDKKPLGETDNKTNTDISVRLIPIFGISMPVIIRIGKSNTTAALSDLNVIDKNGLQTLKLTFNRRGNMSMYGDLTVDYISAENQISRVGITKGLAVYTPNSTRIFELPLNSTPGINYHSGKLHIIYSDQTLKTKLAEEYITLN